MALPPPEMDMAVVVDLEAKAAAIMVVEAEDMGEVAVVNPQEDMEGAKVAAEAMEEVKGAMEAAAATRISVVVVAVAMEAVMAADMVLETMMADMGEVHLTAEAVVEVDMIVEEEAVVAMAAVVVETEEVDSGVS